MTFCSHSYQYEKMQIDILRGEALAFLNHHEGKFRIESRER